MIDEEKIVVVMPAYNATETLKQTYDEVKATGVVDHVILLDDTSHDTTAEAAKNLGAEILLHERNRGYGAKLSEYHTGYRDYSAEVLRETPFDRNSDDFIFDNQILAQIHWTGTTIAEITCPTKHFPEASSIRSIRSVKYGARCIRIGLQYRLARLMLLPVPKIPQSLSRN